MLLIPGGDHRTDHAATSIFVIRLGVSSPPWSKEAADLKGADEPQPLRTGLTGRLSVGRGPEYGRQAEAD